MQCTANFQDHLAVARLAEAADVVHKTAALDATVHRLDAHTATGEAAIDRFCRRVSARPAASWSA